MNKQCAYCVDGILVSIQGMAEFKCNKCGKFIDETDYLGEIVRITSEHKKKPEAFKE